MYQRQITPFAAAVSCRAFALSSLPSSIICSDWPNLRHSKVLSETCVKIHHGPIHLWQIKQAGPQKSVQLSGVTFDPSLGRTFIRMKILDILCMQHLLVNIIRRSHKPIGNAVEPQVKLEAQHSVLLISRMTTMSQSVSVSCLIIGSI